MSFSEKDLSVWVLLWIGIGVAVPQFLLFIPTTLGAWEYSQVNFPVAILIWVMICPMMLKGIGITLFVDWLVKPFTMFAVTWLFVKVIFAPWIDELRGTEFLAGAVLRALFCCRSFCT